MKSKIHICADSSDGHKSLTVKSRKLEALRMIRAVFLCLVGCGDKGVPTFWS